MSKLAPDHPISKVRKVFTMEFDDVEACIAIKDKIGTNQKFNGWIATFGKDPCGGVEKDPVKGTSPHQTLMMVLIIH